MSDLKGKLNHARSRLFHRASNQSATASSPSTPSSPKSERKASDTPRRESSFFHLLTQRSPSQTPNPSASEPSGDRATPPAETKNANPEKPSLKNVTEGVSPLLTVEAPSPDTVVPAPIGAAKTTSTLTKEQHPQALPTPDSRPVSPTSHSTDVVPRDPNPLDTTIDPKDTDTSPSRDAKHHRTAHSLDYFGNVVNSSQQSMVRRKVWIKRAGASPTLVQISQDDLVDDLRDMVLRKYANSLGRSFDAPDVSLRITPREKSQPERLLGPEEPICNIIDAYFPGGQLVEEALLIDVPRKRTPQPSPRIMNNYTSNYFEDQRPLENGTDYFPPMPAISPHPSQSAASHDSKHSHAQHAHPHSISVIETGQIQMVPSPREKRSHHRPRLSRQHTSSPTAAPTSAPGQQTSQTARQQWPRTDADAKRPSQAPPAPTLPTPPTAEGTTKAIGAKASTPPADRLASPRPTKPKKSRKAPSMDMQRKDSAIDRRPSHPHPQISFSLIEATVPPINVLIVEDNPINLRLLEMFTKRLKVRWQTAMNGRDAVLKWRAGGFHLVLMDIQLPIMSGLEATKEIRRLERVNGIGVFAKGESEHEDAAPKSSMEDGTAQEEGGQADQERPEGDDKLSDEGLFKSPVIIVALTASSLQSDRHEALAAGCNDFLTKPVHFSWLERKVMEWGCMQALIDFDGWRKWKDLAAAAEEEKLKEEELDPEKREKREKKEAKRAALLAKMGETSQRSQT